MVTLQKTQNNGWYMENSGIFKRDGNISMLSVRQIEGPGSPLPTYMNKLCDWSIMTIEGNKL